MTSGLTQSTQQIAQLKATSLLTERYITCQETSLIILCASTEVLVSNGSAPEMKLSELAGVQQSLEPPQDLHKFV